MHIEPRNGASIDRIYLHTNEGPESEGGAAGLANYLKSIDGGYHVIVDDKTTVRCADDHDIVWGEGGDNLHALAVCMIGYASQNAAQWADPYSHAEFERAAQQVAAWCKQYNVPAVHVPAGAPGHAPTARGIAEHADDHAPASQGHTDPGAAFPIEAFVARVAAILKAQHDFAQFLHWCSIVESNPLTPGESSWTVTALKHALNSIGEGPGNESPFFGQKLADDVVAFKKKHGVPSTSPRFGGVALAALLKLL